MVVANEKLYVNYDEGFIGTSLKKDNYLFECSDIDDVIVIRKDGSYVVTRVSTKAFVGKNIMYVGLFKKNDNRTIYNVVYRDGRVGNNYIKRFPVKGVTRDKEYNLTQGKDMSRILYFSVNPNGEAELIRVSLKPKPKLKKAYFEYDFSELAIKNRNANGNILSKHSVLKISLKEKGVSTLGGRKIWFDTGVNRLNADERGIYLGEFSGKDRIIIITQEGQFRLTNYDLSNHFEDNILIIEKFKESDVYSVVFFDADQSLYYLKRFRLDGQTNGKTQSMVGTNPASKMTILSKEILPRFKINFGGKDSERQAETISAAEFIALKSFRARGKRLTNLEVKKILELKAIEAGPEKVMEIYGDDYLPPEDEIDDQKEEIEAAQEPVKQKPIKIEAVEDVISQPIELPVDIPVKAPKKKKKKKKEKEPDKEKKQNNSGSQMTLGL